MATNDSPLVLVTGINGYIGSAAVLQFLAAGYRVRGTVRSLSTYKPALVEAFSSYIEAGTLQLVEVSDFFAPDAWDHVVRGVHGIAHVAAPGMRSEDTTTDPNIIIPQVRDGMTNLLRAAQSRAGPQLKSVVLLSSLAAIMRFKQDPGYRYTGDESVNTQYIDMAIQRAAKPNPGLVYTAIKAAIEQAFFDFVGQQPDGPDRSSSSAFAGTVVSPSFVIGPVVVRPRDPTALPASVRSAWHVVAGGPWPADFPFPAFVDVRDVARALVFAVQQPDRAASQRLLLSAYRINFQAYADGLREKLPERRDAIRQGEPGEGYPADYVTWGAEEVGTDGSRFVQLSGQDYIPFPQCIVDTAKSFQPYMDEGKDKELGDEVPVLY
ncbi:ketoreductase [Sodiomyces alkalinus F11]|uniref:Ketoreductase n=1 Tax=Sodiomyces alkalinus (strain CBS 110278 / VKM F-3762 / F11) TaxID=1314773 RepID=A0A3N2PPC4_SODAK|nr:ketoreductase [Sodiomyces alkalinus F11]ROT36359.1 ketoreductase [Sodiomyces alkalinus F11]